MMYAKHVLRVNVDWSTLRTEGFGAIGQGLSAKQPFHIPYVPVPEWFRNNPRLYVDLRAEERTIQAVGGAEGWMGAKHGWRGAKHGRMGAVDRWMKVANERTRPTNGQTKAMDGWSTRRSGVGEGQTAAREGRTGGRWSCTPRMGGICWICCVGGKGGGNYCQC